MAKKQLYGIKYPFSSENNDNVYIDLNETYEDLIKSEVLHIIFTPKGQKLRDPYFGTNLIQYIFEPSDQQTFDKIKSEITTQISMYIPNVVFKDIKIEPIEGDDHNIAVLVTYSVKKGNTETTTTVGVKL